MQLKSILWQRYRTRQKKGRSSACRL